VSKVITARGIAAPDFSVLHRSRLQSVRSDKDVHFTGELVKNASKQENITGLASNKVIITGISIRSKQALNLRLLFFSKDLFTDSDLDEDTLVGAVDLDLLKYRKIMEFGDEETEEQAQHNAQYTLYTGVGGGDRAGQRLTIPNRPITKLGFWLLKNGSPTGNVTFTIRKVSDDSPICSKLWGDAVNLPTLATYEEVTFDAPQTINEEARILVEFSGGDASNSVYVRIQQSDVKANEYATARASTTGIWIPSTGYDCAYKYTYRESLHYQLDLKNVDLPYEDLDKTKELHVILNNLSPTAKSAGTNGEVVIEVSYEPAA